MAKEIILQPNHLTNCVTSPGVTSQPLKWQSCQSNTFIKIWHPLNPYERTEYTIPLFL